jgi:exo-1,4-beta-D-glucosaminidase
MLNNAWPSMIWHLYDYYLRPGGGYYGTKQACEPLHVQYSYDDASVAVVNERREPAKGLTVTARVLDLNLRETFAKTETIDVAADGVARLFAVPQPPADPATTYFVRLTLDDSSGARVSTNFYWLSSRPDEIDWAGTKWYYTPTRRHADLSAVTRLPATRLAIAAEPAKGEQDAEARVVVVENSGSALAFQIHLLLVDA